MPVKIAKAEQLRSQFDSLAKTNPSFSFWVYLVNHHCGTYVFPEDVLVLCNSLNIITLDDLFAWVKVANGTIIMPILEPDLQIELTVQKTGGEIQSMITSFCECGNCCHWSFGDVRYYLMSRDDLVQVLAKCQIDRKKYIPDTFDCEDFARTTKSWCALHGIGNIAFAYAEVEFFLLDRFLFSHGINLVPLADGSIVCVEPQNDRIWSADKPEHGFGADKMKIRFVQF
jgi:hypothetical protein